MTDPTEIRTRHHNCGKAWEMNQPALPCCAGWRDKRPPYDGPERRQLDRTQPAAKLTTTVEDRTVFWVRAGSTEITARDAADQARIIALHNVINNHRVGVFDLRTQESEQA